MPSQNFQHTSKYLPVFVAGLLEKTVSVFGSVNIVVANAGINNEADWFKTMDINAVSARSQKKTITDCEPTRYILQDDLVH